MRLDKWLKVSRLIKRRTVANEACDNDRVWVAGRPQRASYDVKVGDVIEVREKSRASVKFKRLTGEDAPVVNVPKWLDRNKNTLQGTVVAMPTRDDIDFPVEEHLIVELYSK